MKAIMAVLIALATGSGLAAETAPTAQLPNDAVHRNLGSAKAADVGSVKVPKATGPDARTVAEIVEKRSALNDKPVLVRGKVVKYTAGVMGKNWLHLRDGSGSSADKTNDVAVTTIDDTKVGDIVMVRGTVRTDVNLGSGYSYAVLIEDARLQK
jgi:hypothetical protein